MKVYIVETYDELLDGPYVPPIAFADKTDAEERAKELTYIEDDGTRHWANVRELELAGYVKDRTCKPVEKDLVMCCPDCDYALGIMSVPAFCPGCGAKVE